jgi:hypothetical protein
MPPEPLLACELVVVSLVLAVCVVLLLAEASSSSSPTNDVHPPSAPASAINDGHRKTPHIQEQTKAGRG